jgi:bifunctional oligoribonuclease and PAP phosphatase NrnA
MPGKIKDIVQGRQHFLVASHIDPDGDAVGSVFAMYWALKSLGREVSVYLKDGVPYRYAFLPGPAVITGTIPEGIYDVIFVVDCGNLSRVGEGHERLKQMGLLVNIDHHATSDAFGSINVIDEKASSTAEILSGVFEELGVSIDYNMAVNMYTAVFTDTGSLRYENSGPGAFSLCERMLRHGVKPADVARMVYENHPKERFTLLGLVLNTLRTYDDDRLALVHVTEEMLAVAGAKKEYTDGFVEYVRQIRGVEVAVLLRQIEKERYKISMRSKGAADVAALCSVFGGGGHRAAAGCRIAGDLQAVEEKLLQAFRTESWGE